MIAPRSFTGDWHASLALAETDRELLARHFSVPLESVIQATTADDRAGIDYWVALPSGRIGVDMKRRSRGASRFWRTPTDPDIIIELSSKLEYHVPGPLYRDSPLPDYFAFAFEDLSGTLFLLPAEPLRAVARSHRQEWIRRYGEQSTTTQTIEYGPYHSTFIALPYTVVVAAINAYNGL